MYIMNRQLNSLGKSAQKKLRDVLGFKTINQAVETYGKELYGASFKKQRKYSDKVKMDTYELMKDEYNIAVKEQQVQKKEQKKVMKKEMKNKVKLGDLDKFVEKWNKKKNKKDNRFSFTIKSGVADIKHTFKFTCIQHFQNWFKKSIEENEVDSQGTIQTKMKDIFDGLLTIENIKIVGGGCNKHKAGTKEIKSSFYKFNLFNPSSMLNNCFFKCLEHITGEKVEITKLRKQFEIPTNTEINISDGYKIINELKLNISIIDYSTNEELDDTKKYIVLKDNHYYALENYECVVLKNKKTKRGLMTFDFETRPTEDFYCIKATGQKIHLLKDSLCCAYYRQYKQEECKNISFVSNGEKASSRQLIDWFNIESKAGRTYNVIAHNGGKFDFYFFISSLTSLELLECDLQFRGTTIISINYRGHLFKDSCCFLTDTLSRLSKSFKITDGKITTMTLNNKEISSEQLCFYKPELTFNQFLELENNEPEFWSLYVKYCHYDCIALFQIWEKFTICINTLIEKINPYLLSKCPLMSSTTIGSHSKKIIVEINKFKGVINKNKKDLETFTGVYTEDKERKINKEKYEFLCKFKRGGISTCNQAGKHLSGITGVDIASQYPASLIYSKIPTGESEWIYEYDKKKYGFYLITDIVFDSYLLKPVASAIKDESLNWATNDMKELYIDSYMLDYVINNYGLKKFKVVKGLVSNQDILGSKIFGSYINTFYNEKKQQDAYLKSKDFLNYNEALRTTIKLYLNSLTGKLVENPSIHYSLEFLEKSLMKTHGDEEISKDIKGDGVLNGQEILKNFNEDKFNDWIVAGIMVYSYSKRLLFEYIKCLPNNSDDVIHIETDGIYFSTDHLEKFTENLNNYKGDYPCCFGEDLGNLKIEKTTQRGQVAYFLGKKFYNITLNDDYIKKPRDDKDKNIYRVKGIPQTTINNDGSRKYLVDTKLYEDIYNGKSIVKSFQTLKKQLFTQNSSIGTFVMSRTIKANQKYNLYH